MLFIDDPLIGITSPKDYWYIRAVRIRLQSIGFWPGFVCDDKPWKYARYYGLYPVIVNSALFASTITFMWVHSAEYSFLDQGHMYLSLFLGVLMTFRAWALPLNPKFHKIVKRFLTSVHLFYHVDKSDYARLMHFKIHKVCHIATVILIIQMYSAMVMFNVIPVYSNYSQGKLNYEELINSTYDLGVYMYYPRDATTNRRSYYIMTVFDWYATYFCGVIICMNDLVLYLMVFHIYGHFKILLNMLATMPRPAPIEVQDGEDIILVDSEMYSEAESLDVAGKLKQCIDYHRFLLHFISAMSDAFGPMLMMYLTFHQVSLCLLLLECSQMSAAALIRYGSLTLSIFQGLVQTCVIFETIGRVSEKLSDQVYALPWECMDGKNRKTVLFFLMNVQTPVQVKAMGITGVGVQTMTTILKTSVSYFAFLRRVPESM